jgi:hypothetical protein
MQGEKMKTPIDAIKLMGNLNRAEIAQIRKEGDLGIVLDARARDYEPDAIRVVEKVFINRNRSLAK